MTTYGTLYSGRPEKVSEAEFPKYELVTYGWCSIHGMGVCPKSCTAIVVNEPKVDPGAIWSGSYLPDGICGKAGDHGKFICGGRLIGNAVRGWMCERCKTIYHPNLDKEPK